VCERQHGPRSSTLAMILNRTARMLSVSPVAALLLAAPCEPPPSRRRCLLAVDAVLDDGGGRHWMMGAGKGSEGSVVVCVDSPVRPPLDIDIPHRARCRHEARDPVCPSLAARPLSARSRYWSGASCMHASCVNHAARVRGFGLQQGIVHLPVRNTYRAGQSNRVLKKVYYVHIVYSTTKLGQLQYLQ
jgi:hypothetical protein